MARGLPRETWRRWRGWLISVLAATAWTACLAAPPPGEGQPFMQYFSPRDYHAGTQCLCATQDRHGVMYVGSIGLVLEYDGSRWYKIDIDSNYVSGIDYEPATDTVFIGAENNIGYLQTLPGGEKKFVSLLPQLPADSREVGTVWGVHVTPDGVFFVGTKQVMRWRHGVFRTWSLTTVGRLRSSWAAGTLYVASPEIGLLRLSDDTFVPASNDPILHQSGVRSVVADSDGALLIGTFHDGLFSLRGGALLPVGSECDGFLKEKGLIGMVRLQDNKLAIATEAAGLLILDPMLRFHGHVDDTAGLHGTNIFHLFEDAEGGLWIGLQAGISRAEIGLPLSVLRAGPNDDMSGSYCAARWFGTLVLGTATGLYRVVPADPKTATSAHLTQFPGIKNTITLACTVDDGMLTISQGKVALFDADARLVPVASEIVGAQGICASRIHPGRVYVVEESGRISTLKRDEGLRRWVRERIVADLGPTGGHFGLAESEQGDLWVESKEHGLFRVELASSGPATVEPFFDRPGPLYGDRTVLLSEGGGPIRFRGTRWFCGLDRSGRSVQPLAEFGKRFNDGSLSPSYIVSEDAKSIWVTASYVHGLIGDALRGRAVAGDANHPPTFRPLPHKVDALIGGANLFFPLEVQPEPLATLLLVGTGPDIVQMDVARWVVQPEQPVVAALIRRAVTNQPSAGTASTGTPILHDPLPYARNSVHFEFAAGTLAFGALPRFQTRLVNFGAGDWSELSDRADAEYLNLPEGSYTFEVRARNADGQWGGVAARSFRILPPWQRSAWAYALYLLASATGIYLLVRWRGRQLRSRNAALETIVDARTGELRRREAELLANERDLVRARDEAETANRAKSAFLANMSHELRTPLNAILGYSQILLKQANLPARNREQVAVIGQSGDYLLSLINEILDLSKIEAGKLTLSPLDFSLPQLLEEVGAAFRPRFAEKGLTFTEIRAPGLPDIVHTDPSRLRQVLFNLLSNSVKFTQKGEVTLDVQPAGPERVRFTVADTGIGIAPDALGDIFLAFHQASGNRLSTQGTGLGLAISQRLVGLLGGRLQVESTPGQGSRFWVELPLAPVRSPDGAPLAILSDPAHGKVAGYDGCPRSLLLVDDVAENRRVLRDFLQPLGFEIEEAADGEACLQVCARQPPDAVLLDLRMGALDGFEVARLLRARAPGAPLGIIAISASVFESDRQRALDAGCDDFLPKPFKEAQLLAILERVLALRWVRSVVPVPPSALPPGETRLSPEELDALLELSLRGDIVGIRKRVDALREAGAAGGAEDFARRLAPLIAAYQMEEIHALLLAARNHGDI